MKRYRIEIEYEGTDYVGWQRQKEAMSVQEAISNALYEFSQENREIISSGRTDSGVHAIEQTAHFDLEKDCSEYTIINAMNYYLRGKKIVILNCCQVDEKFHARYSAKQRQYIYKLNDRNAPLALNEKRMWHVAKTLDEHKMSDAAQFFLGTHNFSSFRASICQAKSPIKTIDEISVTRHADEIWVEIAARSFLHNMVRNIVGTLKLVGHGDIEPSDILGIINAKKRSAAGPTAKSHGLYFKKVLY